MTLIELALARIAEMEKRAEGATPGPWTKRDTASRGQSLLVRGDPFLQSTQLPTEDVELIASARTDLPALTTLLSLPDRELDARLAECMGYRREKAPKDFHGDHGGNDILVPPGVDHKRYGYPPIGPLALTFFVPEFSSPSSGRSLFDGVEAEIRRRGLALAYWRAIRDALFPDDRVIGSAESFEIATARAKIRTAAAVVVLEAK